MISQKTPKLKKLNVFGVTPRVVPQTASPSLSRGSYRGCHGEFHSGPVFGPDSKEDHLSQPPTKERGDILYRGSHSGGNFPPISHEDSSGMSQRALRQSVDTFDSGKVWHLITASASSSPCPDPPTPTQPPVCFTIRILNVSVRA